MGGISVYDLLQVKNYGDASKLLTEKVRSSTFALDKATACAIHNLSVREDALVWGLFRTGNISIEGVKYKPPEASALGTLAQYRRRESQGTRYCDFPLYVTFTVLL